MRAGKDGSTTHKVTALRTFAFPGPSIKLPPADTLVMGAMVTVIGSRAFAVTRMAAICAAACRPYRDHVDDFVAVAERLSARRICGRQRAVLGSIVPAGPGIVECCGHRLPARQRHASRTASQNLEQGGSEVLAARRPNFLERSRGDRVRRTRVVHANAHHMATAIESTREAVRVWRPRVARSRHQAIG